MNDRCDGCPAMGTCFTERWRRQGTPGSPQQRRSRNRLSAVSGSSMRASLVATVTSPGVEWSSLARPTRNVTATPKAPSFLRQGSGTSPEPPCVIDQKIWPAQGCPRYHLRTMKPTAGSGPVVRIDRRLDERGDCLIGLARWLESSRRSLGVSALAVADPSGCLVAGAGAAQTCEELAAQAPLAADTRRCSLADGSAWLCAPDNCDDSAWNLTRQGCLRILGLREAA
jgi:hypothetical protein